MPKTRRKYKGYIQIHKPSHPAAMEGGYVSEHKLVMEEYIDQLIPPDYEIHHIDHNTENNTISNLLLIPSRSAHMELHSLEDDCDKLGYDELYNGLLAWQEKIKRDDIDLFDLFDDEQREVKKRFLGIADFPEYAELVAGTYQHRNKSLKILLQKYDPRQISLTIRNDILSKIYFSEHEEFVAPLLWSLGEIQDYGNMKFIFYFLKEHQVEYKEISKVSTIVEATRAIYKIAREKNDYSLGDDEYIVFCNIFLGKSKNAILWGLRIINILVNVDVIFKEGLYKKLDTNKLYYKSKREFELLVSKTEELANEEIDTVEISLSVDEKLDLIEEDIKSFPIEKEPTENNKEIRKKHPRAYEKWDSDKRNNKNEDDLLKQAYGLTQEINQLVEIFQRNKGAIESRLLKLGVITKDDLDYYKKKNGN